MSEPSILKYFSYSHLPPHLREISRKFYELAHELVDVLNPGAELSTALRKLLEGKDAAVRQAVDDHNQRPVR